MVGRSLDFSWSRPDPQAVVDAGYHGIIGYVGKDKTGKLLQKDWFDRYVAAGLSITLVWELGAQHAVAGYNAGVADAKAAAAQADALGYSRGSCIYFVLEDPTKIATSQWDAVVAYAQGLNDANIPFEIGGYGSKKFLNHVKSLNLIARLWYVGPWGDNWDGADLVQTYRTDMPEIAGTPRNQYDEDWSPTTQWGQHPHAQPTPPMPEEDEELATSVKPHFGKLKGSPHIHLVQRDYASKRLLSPHEKDGYVWVNGTRGGTWLESTDVIEYDQEMWDGIPYVGKQAPKT